MLTAEQAYQAGSDDFKSAAAISLRRKKPFVEVLARLWQERIGRGDLPPIEKAS